MSDQNIRVATFSDKLQEVLSLVRDMPGCSLSEYQNSNYFLIEVTNKHIATDLMNMLRAKGYLVTHSQAGFHTFIRVHLTQESFDAYSDAIASAPSDQAA